jgi:hypothetical protein
METVYELTVIAYGKTELDARRSVERGKIVGIVSAVRLEVADRGKKIPLVFCDHCGGAVVDNLLDGCYCSKNCKTNAENSEKYIARNEAIHAAREAGQTFVSIGKEFNLTAARISHICISYERRAMRRDIVEKHEKITSALPPAEWRLDEMDISRRSFMSLKNDNLHTLGDVSARTQSQLLRIPNFGRLSLCEIEIMLERNGLRLAKADSIVRRY